MSGEGLHEQYFNYPFVVDEVVLRLMQIAEEYHSACDLFDNVALSGPMGRDGSRMPANGWEMTLCNRHAKEVIGWLSRKYHVPERVVRQAIRDHSEIYKGRRHGATV